MITPEEFHKSLPQVAVNMFLKWGQFMYDNVRFNMPDSPLHAKSHCERVLLHALAIGVGELGIEDSESLEILAHASVFHDTRRLDEYLDTGHGARAAVYYTEFCRDNSDKISYHPEAAYLMRYHDIDDGKGIEAIRRAFPDDSARVEKLYAIFKDADALDRCRLGRWGLDVKYLRTATARKLVKTAESLVATTVDPNILAYYDHLIDDMMKERGK
ncbi:MAG: hypothetical protein NC411_01690 [Bacteroides sp.]|nr:hypothetical protein [Bacteroides sp.]